MRKTFRSIDEVLGSDFITNLGNAGTPGLDRILKSTGLEDRIYADLRKGDTDMDRIEAECAAKLSTFPALSRDVYQSFYSLGIRRNDESALSDTTKQFNLNILDGIMNGYDYPTIKSICKGRQLPAYDAASEFINSVSSRLDDLLKEAGGDRGAMNTLEKLTAQEDALMHELDELLRNREKQSAPDSSLDSKIVDKANKAAGKAQQVEAIGRQVHDNVLKNRDVIGGIVAQAMKSANDKAEETALSMAAWGVGDSETSPEQLKINREIMERVRTSPTLMEVSKYLGRFKEMAAKARRNGYAYGRGEKYTLELGNDLQRVITSEFSMLAVPEAIPLFMRKYQSKGLQQYKRREPIYKGGGDIVMCLDESSSTREDAPWGKAVALTLLDAAMTGARKFALIHFSDTGRYQTDLFVPGQYDTTDVIRSAETFLGGNTDFETPLGEAIRLIEQEGFENADIVFVTDGICSLPAAFLDEVKRKQAAHGFAITGVLMDVSSPGMDFSIKPFCEEVYRTSELSRDCIVESLISRRV